MNPTLFHILSALGNAVINSLWQSGLIWLAITIYIFLFKKTNAAKLSSMSFVAILLCFGCFIFTLWQGLVYDNITIGIFRTAYHIEQIQRALPVLAILYLAFIFVPATHLINGLFRIHTIKNNGLHKLPGHFKIFSLNAISYLGIKRKIRIYISSLVDSPLTVGYIKPMILLPVAAINHLSIQQVEAIILHELAHIKQQDYLKNFISQVIGAFMYFNPFVSHILKMQNLEREKSADAWVLQFEFSQKLYATALFSLAKSNMNTSRQAFFIKASHDNLSLLSRIEWMTGNRSRSMPGIKKIITFLTIILLSFTLGIYKTPMQLQKNDAVVFTPTSIASFITPPDNTPIYFVQGKEAGNPVNSSSPVAVKPTTVYNSESIGNNNMDENISQSPDKLINTLFASVNAPEIPTLTTEQEDKVQNSIAASKKILAEMAWKSVDLNLGEVLTQKEKEGLKNRFILLFSQSDWSNVENRLKLTYQYIDWPKVDSQLYTKMLDVTVDSLYKTYQIKLQNFNLLKKSQIDSLQKVSLQLDSIQKKRIFEL